MYTCSLEKEKEEESNFAALENEQEEKGGWNCLKCEEVFQTHKALRQHESKHGYLDAVYEEFSKTRRCPFCKATFQLPVSMDSAVMKKNRFQGLTTHLRLPIHYKCQNA